MEVSAPISWIGDARVFRFTARLELGRRRAAGQRRRVMAPAGCWPLGFLDRQLAHQVAQATLEAACKRWPGETITLRQGARIIEDSRKIGFA